MKELASIVSAYAGAKAEPQAVVLATVVKTSGSTYRRPGARMLIGANGQMLGSVSGGCLERDVFRQARRVLNSRQAKLVTYDSTSEDDIVWGFGLGCNGTVDVLIEPASPGLGEQMQFLGDCLRERRAGVLAKIFAADDTAGGRAGDFLMLRPGSPAQSNITDDELNGAVFNDAMRTLAGGESRAITVAAGRGRAEVFFEMIEPPVRLVLFGAGHDAVPLLRLAKELGWQVAVVDGRPGYATVTKFPAADEVIVARPEAIRDRVLLDEWTVAVVMNHNYPDDLGVLRSLLAVPLKYVGLLGPKHRARKLLAELTGNDAPPADEWLARLHGPAGLDVGAEVPEEIALSILAEIRAVLRGRRGGFLKDRQGPINAA
jgi:xanthine dehydrogenase accessory factor